jgi:hypothetical protein
MTQSEIGVKAVFVFCMKLREIGEVLFGNCAGLIA